MPELNAALQIEEIFRQTIPEIFSAVYTAPFFLCECEQTDAMQYAGAIGFSGGKPGIFILRMDENSLRKVAAGMTGMEPEQVETADLRDCIGEISNMICGTCRSKMALFQIPFVISTPFVVDSTGALCFSYKKKADVQTLCYCAEELRVVVQMIFF